MSTRPSSKVTVGGRTYVQRKVKIVYVTPRGAQHGTSRWLSQVEAFAAKLHAARCTDVRWRLHDKAPWHLVPPTHC